MKTKDVIILSIVFTVANYLIFSLLGNSINCTEWEYHFKSSFSVIEMFIFMVFALIFIAVNRKEIYSHPDDEKTALKRVKKYFADLKYIHENDPVKKCELFKNEGGFKFTNDPIDKGGETICGVTLSTWKTCGYDKDGDGDIDVNDLKMLNEKDVFYVFKKYYWDRCKADNIKYQRISNLLVDWTWASGVNSIKGIQRIVGVDDDGVLGTKTLLKINSLDQNKLANDLYQARLDFIQEIVDNSVNEYKKTNPNCTEIDLLKKTQKRFFKGWVNRVIEVNQLTK